MKSHASRALILMAMSAVNLPTSSPYQLRSINDDYFIINDPSLIINDDSSIKQDHDDSESFVNIDPQSSFQAPSSPQEDESFEMVDPSLSLPEDEESSFPEDEETATSISSRLFTPSSADKKTAVRIRSGSRISSMGKKFLKKKLLKVLCPEKKDEPLSLEYREHFPHF